MRAGSSYPRREDLAELKYTVIHHTDSANIQFTAQSVAAYHTGSSSHLPFPAIAYTVYIEEDGTAVLCHDLYTVTWAQGAGSISSREGVGNNNWEGIGVCFSGPTPNDAQIKKIKLVCDYIDYMVGRKLKRVGHRDVSRVGNQPLTVCPGDDYKNWLPLVQ